jgi:hypothetical protein
MRHLAIAALVMVLAPSLAWSQNKPRGAMIEGVCHPDFPCPSAAERAAQQAADAEAERARDAELVRKREEEDRAARLREMERQAAEAQAARERADATRVQRLWINPDVGPMVAPPVRAPEPPADTTPTASMLVKVCFGYDEARKRKDIRHGFIRSPSKDGYIIDYRFDYISVIKCSDGRHAIFVKAIIDDKWKSFPTCDRLLSSIVNWVRKEVQTGDVEQAALHSFPDQIREMIPLELVCDRMYEGKERITLFSNIP